MRKNVVTVKTKLTFCTNLFNILFFDCFFVLLRFI